MAQMVKLYTRRGDRGQSLLKGAKIAKDSSLLAAIGSLDELVAFLGWAKLPLKGKDRNRLRAIQKDIQTIMGQLAGYGAGVPAGRVAEMEKQIDTYWQGKEKNKFVIPGSNEIEARLQIARTVCRRAERAVVGLNRSQPVEETIMAYLNRLSDFLFALAMANTNP